MKNVSPARGLTRRRFLAGSAAFAVAGSGRISKCSAQGGAAAGGAVIGHQAGRMTGAEILAKGGNAVDAVVAASMTAGTVSMHMCGIAGYGGHLTFGNAKTGKVSCIDFNSTAPAAAREDIYPLDEKGRVVGGVNNTGWLAAGVPGFLGGMQAALDHFGTIGFAEAAGPAIRLAREGFRLEGGLARLLASTTAKETADPGLRAIAHGSGNKPTAGGHFVNPGLAEMLETLAKANSVEAFYRGDVAQVVADAFARNKGLVTAADLAAYEAPRVDPVTVDWNGYGIHTAPLTAGGLTTLQSIQVLKALGKLGLAENVAQFAFVEALRLTWLDRLTLFGDPAVIDVPVDKLLSPEYAAEVAERVHRAIVDGKPIPHPSPGSTAGGTVHLSASDRDGNLAAITITQGAGLGARVGIPELGLVLGHGLSRFEPDPGRPNSIGPGKRPLNNMCPTIVTRNGVPRFALGGAGGRKIPNALLDVVRRLVGEGNSLSESMAAPRLHTDGSMAVRMDPAWKAAAVEDLKERGYEVTRGKSATISAVGFDPETGTSEAIYR